MTNRLLASAIITRVQGGYSIRSGLVPEIAVQAKTSQDAIKKYQEACRQYVNSRPRHPTRGRPRSNKLACHICLDPDIAQVIRTKAEELYTCEGDAIKYFVNYTLLHEGKLA